MWFHTSYLIPKAFVLEARFPVAYIFHSQPVFELSQLIPHLPVFVFIVQMLRANTFPSLPVFLSEILFQYYAKLSFSTVTF